MLHLQTAETAAEELQKNICILGSDFKLKIADYKCQQIPTISIKYACDSVLCFARRVFIPKLQFDVVGSQTLSTILIYLTISKIVCRFVTLFFDELKIVHIILFTDRYHNHGAPSLLDVSQRNW